MVWRDLGLNPGLLDHWRTLQWAKTKGNQKKKWCSLFSSLSTLLSTWFLVLSLFEVPIHNWIIFHYTRNLHTHIYSLSAYIYIYIQINAIFCTFSHPGSHQNTLHHVHYIHVTYIYIYIYIYKYISPLCISRRGHKVYF